MSDLQFTAITDEQLELGEGAAWYGDTFWFVDLLAGRVLSTDPGLTSVLEVLRLDVPVGAVAPTETGGLVLAAGHGIALAQDGQLTWLARPEAEASTAITDEQLELGEGAAWYGDTFWFVDLLAGRVLSTDPGLTSVREVLRLDVPVGAVAPTETGGLVLAAGHGIALVQDGQLTWLARPEASTAMRMNDGTTDPQGRFWATSMAYDNTPGAGSLYRVGEDRDVVRVLADLAIPNGPAFVPDGDRMYLADSARGLILSFHVDPTTGDLAEGKVFAEVADGSPDGMCVDANGYVWSAVWGASCLHRYAPDGTLADVIPVPARQPTKVALSTTTPGILMVTTATHGLDAPGVLDGRTLVAEVDVSGVAAAAFRG